MHTLDLDLVHVDYFGTEGVDYAYLDTCTVTMLYNSI